MIWVLVVVGAMLGAPARYLSDVLVTRRWPNGRLPWATVLVNVCGSAALGVMAGIMSTEQHRGLWYAAAGTGFCGAFTTFSAFTWETFALAEDGYVIASAANVLLSLGLGLGAATAGYLLA